MPTLSRRRLKFRKANTPLIFIGLAFLTASALFLSIRGGTSPDLQRISFPTAEALDRASQILVQENVRDILSPTTVTLPFSNFTQVQIVTLENVLSRCIEGDPRHTPFLDSLALRFSEKISGTTWYSLYFGIVSPAQERTLRTLFKEHAIEYVWLAKSASPRYLFWVFTLVFSLFTFFGLRTKADPVFRLLLVMPWLLLALLVPSLIGAALSVLGITSSLSIFLRHSPRKSPDGKYVLSDVSLRAVFRTLWLYILPIIALLIFEFRFMPVFLLAAILEFLLLFKMDRVISLERRRLLHEPPAFVRISSGALKPMSYLNYGLLSMSLVLFVCGFLFPSGGVLSQAGILGAKDQPTDTTVAYELLIDHAQAQNGLTYGRFIGTHAGVGDAFPPPVFSRDARGIAIVQKDNSPENAKEDIDELIRKSTCLRLTSRKKPTREQAAATLTFSGSQRSPIATRALLIYIMSFVPLVGSSVQGFFLSRKMIVPKTQIRQEA